MYDEFAYSFKVSNKQIPEVINEIISLVNYLKTIYNENNIKRENSLDDNKTKEKQNEIKIEEQKENYSNGQQTTTDVVKNNKSLDANKNENNNNNNIVNKSLDGIKNVNNNKIANKYVNNNTKKIEYNITRVIGMPKIIKDSNQLFFFKLYKTTSPVMLIESSKGNLLFNRLEYSFTFTQSDEQCENNCISFLNKEEEEEFKRKEKFVVDVLIQFNLINEKQRQENYFLKKILPMANDGQFIARLINILEGKKENVIKGISNETFFKTNINLNFNKIFDFLNQKDNFISKFTFEDEFYNNQIKIFNFIYEITDYYMKKRKLLLERISIYQKQNKIERNNNTLIKIANMQVKNTPLTYITKEYEERKKTQIKNESRNESYILNPSSLLGISQNTKMNYNFKQFLPMQKNNISKEKLMEIRKNIMYEHYPSKPIHTTKCTSDITKKNIESKKKKKKYNEVYSSNIKVIAPVYGENEKFDISVDIIQQWLRSIGINSEVNFYVNTMEEFKDGILLYNIIYQLEANYHILPKINFHPKTPPAAINNIRLIIEALPNIKHNFPLTFLNKQKEIYEASPSTILNLLQTIRNSYSFNRKINEDGGKELSMSNSQSKTEIKGKDQSKRNAVPLTKDIRQKFLTTSNKQMWA